MILYTSALVFLVLVERLHGICITAPRFSTYLELYVHKWKVKSG